MPHRRKNLFDEWDEQLDVITPIKRAILSFYHLTYFPFKGIVMAVKIVARRKP